MFVLRNAHQHILILTENEQTKVLRSTRRSYDELNKYICFDVRGRGN